MPSLTRQFAWMQRENLVAFTLFMSSYCIVGCASIERTEQDIVVRVSDRELRPIANAEVDVAPAPSGNYARENSSQAEVFGGWSDDGRLYHG